MEMVTKFKTGIIGGGGLLGRSISHSFPTDELVQLDWKFFLTEDETTISRHLRDLNLSQIINCAAHTDVEYAEINPGKDYTGNVILPRKIASACVMNEVFFAHFSSTGCYGDWKTSPYLEEDFCAPTTKHHQHKLEAEHIIQNSGCDHLIIRTGWLFGSGNLNLSDFVSKRIAEAKSASSITSDITQRGNPTNVQDVADRLMILLSSKLKGIVNVTNTGSASRFDYVKVIIDAAEFPCDVVPGPAYARKAKVSKNEAAINNRMRVSGLPEMADWETSLRSYISTLL